MEWAVRLEVGGGLALGHRGQGFEVICQFAKEETRSEDSDHRVTAVGG